MASSSRDSWALEFIDEEHRLGASIHLTLGDERAIYNVAVVGARRPLVVLYDDEIPRPRTGLDLRSDGLWSAITVESPGEHWSVGLEAFALAYDDAATAASGAPGDRIALGFDLEWEAAAPAPIAGAHACLAYGDVLLGEERLAVNAAPGYVRHPVAATGWVGGRLDDGSFYADTDVDRVKLSPRHEASAGGLTRVLCTIRTPDGRSGVAWVEGVAT